MRCLRAFRFVLLPLAIQSAGAQLDRDDVTAAVTTALAGHAGPLVTHYDPGLQMLVVVDGERRTAALYSLSSEGIDLMGRRDLDPALLRGGKPPAEMLPAEPPQEDVPAGELPDLPLPANAVRIFYSREESHRGTVWRVNYVAPGEVPAVFADLRAQMTGWTVHDESVSSGSRATAQIRARRDMERIELVVRPARHSNIPGHVHLSCELVRERD